MKEICKIEYCTGCAVCMNRCEQKAITMQPDNRGFLRPVIAQELCIDCGMCLEKCPQVKRNAPTREGKAYAALAINDALRGKSSSGGVFSLLADRVLDVGGVVFGAAMCDDRCVRHVKVESKDELARLRGSK